MYVYRRPDSPYYWATIKISGRREMRFSTRAVNKTEAMRVMVQRAAEEEEKLAGHDTITLGDAIERARRAMLHTQDYSTFAGRCKKAHAPGGVHTAESYAGRYALPSEMPLHELQDRHIEDYKTARLAEGTKPSTINNELKVINKAVKVSKGYRTPIDLTVQFLPTRPRLRHLLHGEEQRLLKELAPDRWMKYQPEPDRRAYHTQAKIQDQYDFTVLLLDTGVRHTEGSTLLWSAVDVVTWETVSIYRSKVYRESVLPISDRLRAILQRRWAESREGALWAYVFPGYDGTKRINKPRGHATLGIRKAITRAGLNRPHLVERYGPFTVHSLRHSFAAKMVQNGMPLHELRDLLGHTTVKTTERYAHLVPNQGAGRMRSILNKTAGEATTSTAVVAAKPTAPASPLAEVSL